MSAGLLLNAPLGSITPETGPPTSLPSTLSERVSATVGETFAPDRYFALNAERNTRAQKIIDDVYDVSGERLLNPFADRVTRAEQGANPGLNVQAIMAKRLEALKDKTRGLRDQYQDQAQQNPDWLNADRIDTAITQQGEAAREKAGNLIDTGNGVGNFIAGMALETATPHGVASLFAPVSRLPGAFAARTVEQFAGQVAKEGALQAGVAMGTTGVADLLDSASRVAAGGKPKSTDEILDDLMGAGVGGFLIGGGIRAAHLGVLSRAPLAVRDAAHVATYEKAFDDSNRMGVDPALHEKLTDQAQADVLRGRAPSLGALLEQADTPLTGLSTILRSSPDKIAVSLPGALDRIKALPDSELESVARQTSPATFAPLDKIETELAQVRQQIAGHAENLQAVKTSDLLDPLSGARLADIETRLEAPALAKRERLQLERERDQMMTTLDPKNELPKKLEAARSELETAEEKTARQALEERAASLEQQHAVARKEADNEVAALRKKLDQAGVGVSNKFGDNVPPGEEAAFAKSADDLYRDMKAGRPAKPPSAHQFIESQRFTDWFKDSKVVSHEGAPLMVYHGTNAAFDHFDPTRLGEATGAPSAREGIFFASNPDVASSYAVPFDAYRNDNSVLGRLVAFTDKLTAGYYGKFNDKILAFFGAESRRHVGSPNVRPAYIKMLNPKVVDFGGKEFREESYFDAIRRAKAEGHDGVILKDTFDGGFDEHASHTKTDVYVVFEDGQVRPFSERFQSRIDYLKSEIGADHLGASSLHDALRMADMDRARRATQPTIDALGPPSVEMHAPAIERDTALETGSPETAKAVDTEVDRVLGRGGEAIKVPEAPEAKTGKFKELRDAAIRFYKEKLEGQKVVNEATGREIEFDATGRRKTTSGAGPDLLRIVPVLPELLKVARPVGRAEIDRSGRAGVVRWHKFRATAELDGKKIDVILTVREKADGSFHYALNKESVAGGGGFSSPESASRGPKEGGDTGLAALDGATGDPLNIGLNDGAGKAVPEHLREAVAQLEAADQAVKDAQAAAGCAMGGLV